MSVSHGSPLDPFCHFEVSIADGPELREAAFQVRKRVYCDERGWESDTGPIETDRFDARAGHVLVTEAATGIAVGTARVVAPLRFGCCLDLPMEAYCGPAILSGLSAGRIGEVGRFSIAKSLRGRAGSSAVPQCLSLIRGILRVSLRLGLTHWCAIMEPSLLRLLRSNGIHFQPIGPIVDCHGLRQPSLASIDRLLVRLRGDKPAVWRYITQEGALCRTDTPPSRRLAA